MARRYSMLRDTTYTELSRSDAADEAAAEFAMDEDAFRCFYERTARGLWAYLVRVTGNRELADDLMQESFYRFLRAAATHESEAHRRNSLYLIATNLARDARRRQLALAVFSVAGEKLEALAGGSATGQPEGSADVTRALGRLRPRERALLWLAYAEGHSHEEIAGALGLRTGSLKTMLFRARRRMASLLGSSPEGKRP